MSCKYWSNAVEGDERKKPLDLLSVEVCIQAPDELFAHKRVFHLDGAHGNDRLRFSQQPRFMPIRNVMLTVGLRNSGPNACRKSLRCRWIFGLRSAGACKNSDPNQYDDSNADPHLWNANEEGSDCQSDDQNYKSDQIGTE